MGLLGYKQPLITFLKCSSLHVNTDHKVQIKSTQTEESLNQQHVWRKILSYYHFISKDYKAIIAIHLFLPDRPSNGYFTITKSLTCSPLVSLAIFTYKDYSDNASQCCGIDHGIYLDCLRKACQYNQAKMNELSKLALLQIINTSRSEKHTTGLDVLTVERQALLPCSVWRGTQWYNINTRRVLMHSHSRTAPLNQSPWAHSIILLLSHYRENG